MAIKSLMYFMKNNNTGFNNIAECWKDLFISRNFELNVLFNLKKMEELKGVMLQAHLQEHRETINSLEGKWQSQSNNFQDKEHDKNRKTSSKAA